MRPSEARIKAIALARPPAYTYSIFSFATLTNSCDAC